MSFTTYAIQIVHEGKCLYSHNFVQFEHNKHLLTGIISAMKTLYYEVFHEDLTTMALEDFHIKIQQIGDIQIFLLYKGTPDMAEVQMTEILDLLCQHDMLSVLQNVAESSVISTVEYDQLDELFSSSLQFDLTSTPVPKGTMA